MTRTSLFQQVEQLVYRNEYLHWRRRHGWPGALYLNNQLTEIEAFWAAKEISRSERRAYHRACRRLLARIKELSHDSYAAYARGNRFVAMLYDDESRRLTADYLRLCELNPEN